LRVDLETVTPCFWTESGSDGSASWSLFWTFDQARSGSVSGVKVSVTSALPEESATELM